MGWLRLLLTIALGFPWVVAQYLYVPVAVPIIGLVAGTSDLVNRSRWQADRREQLEAELAGLLPREAPADGLAAARARVEARRAELEADLPAYGGELARGLVNLAMVAVALGVVAAWLRRRRLREPRLWLLWLNAGVALLAGAAAALQLAFGEGGPHAFALELVAAAAGLVAAGGWLFFGDTLEDRFIRDG